MVNNTKRVGRRVVQVHVNLRGEYEVRNIETSEILSVWDSLYLAKKSVCTINRNCYYLGE